MANPINKGSQVQRIQYGQKGTSRSENEAFHEVVPVGIYKGATLSKIDASTVQVSEGLYFIQDSTSSANVSLRVETSIPYSLTGGEVTEARPYIVASYDWVNSVNNYMDILAKAFGEISGDDLVIGKATFDGGGVLQETFLYDERDNAFLPRMSMVGETLTIDADVEVNSITTPEVNSTEASSDTYFSDNYLSSGEEVVVSDWSGSTTYSSAGTVVNRFGMHFTSTGEGSNLNKDPINPANSIYWYCSPGTKKLIEYANRGISERGGMHKVNNVQDADYQTALLLDKAKFGATTYDFFLVHLDGSAITGNATLEAIFDPDGAKEYPFIDLYAPEAIGVKTLVDKRGYIDRPMTDVGGVAETLAEMQLDQLQGHWHLGGIGMNDGGSGIYGKTTSGVPGISTARHDQNSGTGTWQTYTGSELSDGTNGTPRTGSETRVSAMVEGLGYIIVMIAE